MEACIDKLEKLPVPQAIMNMAIPSIIGLLVMAIYNIVDTMFVAWLGTEATGAVQIIYPLVVLSGAIGITLGIGGGSLISRLLGKNQPERANKVVSSVFYVSIGVGLSLTLFGYLFLNPMIRILGATDEIAPFAKDYASFLLFAAAAQIINQSLSNMLRAEGSAKIAMVGMLSGAILNIILDPIFIFGFGLGIKGAALATTISQFVSTAFLVYQFTSGRSMLKISKRYICKEKSLYHSVFTVGTPSFFRQILTGLSIILINNAAVLYGDAIGVAAVGIVLRTMMIIMYVIMGLSQGFQPVAGYSHGSGNLSRLKESFYFTLKASFLIAAFSGIIFYLFGDIIYSIYKPEPEVLALAIRASNYYLFSLLLMSITNVIATYYQALGHAKNAFILSITRQGIAFVPAIMLLPRFFGLSGVIFTQPVADIITLTISTLLFLSTEKELLSLKLEPKKGLPL
jgi:putative MATE family efflux protein